MKRIISLILTLLVCVFCFAGCYAEDAEGGMAENMAPTMKGDSNNIYYSADEIEMEAAEDSDDGTEDSVGNTIKFIENPFIKTADEPISTFSADVDTASYSYFRKLVGSGYSLDELIATGGAQIRTEEMINYFDYDYKGPAENELFGVNVQIADCPWNEEAALLMLGLKTEETEIEADNNLVFLIDVSGSMRSSDKLPLLKKAFAYLVSQLDEGDRVSIVTYSGEEEVVLKGCEGSKSDKIMKAVNRLEAEGSTNGEAGLKMAYSLAQDYFIEGGNNRIIMASDGDLNVGMSSAEELKNYVSQKRESGIYLSVLGFGTGNYKDANMEALADNGNGVYYYIDGEAEAEKVFGSDIFSTLYTVGRDVKLQLEFNAEAVEQYRLVGYENRLLNKEDFLDDTKDAGDVGAGHCVTVCYEIILHEGAEDAERWAGLSIRYKLPDAEKSEQRDYTIGSADYTNTPNEDFRFVCEVVRTSMLLHESKYIKGVELEDIVAELSEIDLRGDAEKTEFLNLLKKIK